jgi:putative addiction module component (TIGR02574 family)
MAVPVLPLNEMTAEEKLQTMEAIWQSLSGNPETIESTEWHQDELRVRKAQLASGETKFVDWETAKAEIRRQTS